MRLVTHYEQMTGVTLTPKIGLDMDLLMHHKIRRVHKLRGICK
jgi:hypothetical protein